MTKEQFLTKLNASLKGLEINERKDIMQDYEEHFMIGLEKGKTEDEITLRLGNPAAIGKEIMANYHLEKVDHDLTAGNIFRAVWAVIGLGFFNLVIILGPFIALAAIIFSFWVVSLSFIVSPLLVLMDLAIHPRSFILFNLFSSIFFCGLGIFIGIGMFYVTKYITKGFVRYLKYNASLVKGGMKHE